MTTESAFTFPVVHIGPNAVIEGVGWIGVLASCLYVIAAFVWMRRDQVKFSWSQWVLYPLFILPSFFTVRPDALANGQWAILAVNVLLFQMLYIVSLPFVLFYLCTVGPRSWWAQKYFHLYKTSEILLLAALANLLADTFGAMLFSSPQHIGRIGGAGWQDGLVIVAPFLAVVHFAFHKIHSDTLTASNAKKK